MSTAAALSIIVDPGRSAADRPVMTTTPQPAWDTRERWGQTEAGMRKAGVSEQEIRARMLADLAQAWPSSEAAKTAPPRGAKARHTSVATRERGLGRGR